jgi:hypothetical protein
MIHPHHEGFLIRIAFYSLSEHEEDEDERGEFEKQSFLQAGWERGFCRPQK